MRDKVTGARRWVVKIGSALLTADGRGLDRNAMAVWVEQMVALHCAGIELVLVSSGAVAAGMSRLGWVSRPSAMHELQAAASVGQMGLVQAWESSFALHGLQTAQVLLTHDDLSDRKRYLNARSTLRTLVELGVVPVINENDTVVTDEIRFGDNDTLAALVANLVEADLLVILTDRDGMFDADPRNNPDAQLIYEARADDPQLDAVAGGSAGALGRGGMQTKLRAARPRESGSGLRRGRMRKLAGLLGGLLLLPALAGAEEIGEVSTVFKWVGPNDKIVVEAFDDPKVQGVTCYLSRAKTGGVKGGLGLAEDRAEASIACRQVGPIQFSGELKDGEEVFKQRTSLVFKSMQVVRFFDRKRNALVYLVYSDRVIEGSPQNAVTAIPLMPWPTAR